MKNESNNQEKKAKAGFAYDFFVNVKTGELMMCPHKFQDIIPPMRCEGKIRPAPHHECELKMY